MTEFSDLDIKSAIQQMNGYEFEEFLSDVWERQGWETEVTSGAGDKGIDIIARMEYPVEQTHLIQAKRYSEGNKVSSPDIQQYSSLPQQENADSVIVVTTSSFTEQATELAESLNVKLIDSDHLCDIIREENAFDILSSYTNLENISSENIGSDVSTDEPTQGQGDTNKPRSEKIKQELINTYTHQLEMTKPEIIDIEFENNDIKQLYYGYQANGCHHLYNLSEEEFENAQRFVKNRKLNILVESREELSISFYDDFNPTYDDIKEDIDIFIELLEQIFDKNLGALTRVEVNGSSTDDGYRGL